MRTMGIWRSTLGPAFWETTASMSESISPPKFHVACLYNKGNSSTYTYVYTYIFNTCVYIYIYVRYIYIQLVQASTVSFAR